MNKADWLDYFEAINGRMPSDDEIAQALAAGEFQDYEETDVPTTQPPLNSTFETTDNSNLNVQSTLTNQGQGVEQTSSLQTTTNVQLENFKSRSKNYFSWLLTNLKNPQFNTEKDYFVFGAITIGLSALFAALTILNFVRRILTSVINTTVDGYSFKTNSPEIYDSFKNAIGDNFGFGKLVYFTLIFAVVYAVFIVIPALLKDSHQGNKLTTVTGTLVSVTPVVLVFNVLAFLSTFLLKTKLTISSTYFYSTLSSITSFSKQEEVMSALSKLTDLMKNVPAIASIKNVVFLVTILSVLGIIVLTANLIKNITKSLGFLKPVYVITLAVIIVLGLNGFADKLIFSSIVEGLQMLVGSVKGLF